MLSVLLTISVDVVLVDRKSLIDACALCHEVLSQLGEEIPESLQSDQISEMIEATSKMLKPISHSDLLKMNEMDERISISMNFYSILSIVAYTAKPEMLPFVACRMVQLTMTCGLCKHSIVGFVLYAIMLCSSKIIKMDIAGASRIGKAAMSCWKKRYYAAEQLPNLYPAYYGMIAPFTEPLQSCADMLRQGFDAGMSIGETGAGFFNSLHHIRTALAAGEGLPILLAKVDYYMKLTDIYQHEFSKANLSVNRETISVLIGNEGITSSTHHAIDEPINGRNARILESVYYHRAIQAYWQGYSERCQHYIRKFILQHPHAIWRMHIITFIEGMISFQLLKRTSNGRLRSIPRNAILVLKTAASLSSWNWQNKVRCNHPHFGALAFFLSLLKHDISDLFFPSAAQ